MRGESENRNKELKVELHAGRLSDHRFLANFFRLYLHAAALNLLVRLRHAVVATAPTSAEAGLPAELPTEALDEPGRKEVLQHAARARSAGRRVRLHLADAADQGGRGGDHALAAGDRAAVGELAAPGPVLEGQPGREPPVRPFSVTIGRHGLLKENDTNHAGWTAWGRGRVRAGEGDMRSPSPSSVMKTRRGAGVGLVREGYS